MIPFAELKKFTVQIFRDGKPLARAQTITELNADRAAAHVARSFGLKKVPYVGTCPVLIKVAAGPKGTLLFSGAAP